MIRAFWRPRTEISISDSEGLISARRRFLSFMKRRIFMAILFGAVSLGFHLIPGYAETPGAQVRTMLDKVMAIQTDPKLQGPAFRDQRRAAIKKIIGENFDSNAMARQTLGQYG